MRAHGGSSPIFGLSTTSAHITLAHFTLMPPFSHMYDRGEVYGCFPEQGSVLESLNYSGSMLCFLIASASVPVSIYSRNCHNA
ncbi:hypothetical protein BJY52DRAFT_1270354 [Lactarius psammicola]|nr:hypothetical protein BJY52DRAFT_1270354 [Lactarius psammicola]